MAAELLVDARNSRRAKIVWRAMGKECQARMSADMSDAFFAPSDDCRVLDHLEIDGLPNHIKAYLFRVRTPTAFIYVAEIELPRHELIVLDIFFRHRYLTDESRPLH